MTNAERLKKLAATAKRWGGQLLQISQEEYDKMAGRVSGFCADSSFSDAPFTNHDLGTNHSKKLIVYVDPETPWYQVVHEMAHVFACVKEPQESEEFSFFGWEVAMANKLEGLAEWVASNKEYGINMWFQGKQEHDFGDMSEKARKALIEERLAQAQQMGLVKRGRPVAIR